MMRCSCCNTELPDDADFCVSCNSPVVREEQGGTVGRGQAVSLSSPPTPGTSRNAGETHADRDAVPDIAAFSPEGAAPSAIILHPDTPFVPPVPNAPTPETLLANPRIAIPVIGLVLMLGILAVLFAVQPWRRQHAPPARAVPLYLGGRESPWTPAKTDWEPVQPQSGSE